MNREEKNIYLEKRKKNYSYYRTEGKPRKKENQKTKKTKYPY